MVGYYLAHIGDQFATGGTNNIHHVVGRSPVRRHAQHFLKQSLAFMALGLPPTDSFWTAPYEKWTSKKAWEGDDFPKDHKWDINPEILYWE